MNCHRIDLSELSRLSRKCGLLGMAALFLAGCGGAGSSGSDDAGAADLAGSADSGDGDGAASEATAVVVTGAFPNQLGGLNTVRLSDRMLVKGIDNTIDADTVVRVEGGKVYALLRTKGLLRIYDPAAGFVHPVDIAVGDGAIAHEKTDPTDVYAIAGGSRLYVAAYSNDAQHAIAVLDAGQPTKGAVKWIALPATAKSNLPRVTQLWPCGGLVYALLEDLDEGFALTGPGRIAIIDPATDALVSDGQPQLFSLAGSNPGGGFPFGMTRFGGACEDVLVADAGDLSGMSMDLGGIERVDLAGRKSRGFVVTGATLGANVGAIASAGPHVLYAVVGAFSNKVIAIEPTAKTVIGDVLGPASYIPFVQVSPDLQQVFVGVNVSMGAAQAAAGLYAAPADGAKITAAPLVFDQPPYGISF